MAYSKDRSITPFLLAAITGATLFLMGDAPSPSLNCSPGYTPAFNPVASQPSLTDSGRVLPAGSRFCAGATDVRTSGRQIITASGERLALSVQNVVPSLPSVGRTRAVRRNESPRETSLHTGAGENEDSCPVRIENPPRPRPLRMPANRPEANVVDQQQPPPPAAQQSEPPAEASTESPQRLPPPTPPDFHPTLTALLPAVDRARGQEIVQMAVESRRQVVEAAHRDQTTLSRVYQDLPMPVLTEHLQQARTSIERTAEQLSRARSGMDPSELSRFRNIYLNAMDKVDFALSQMRKSPEWQANGDASPFGPLTGPTQIDQPNRASATFASFFGPRNPAQATTQDALVNRIVLLAGLPARQQSQTTRELRLTETPNLSFPDGSSQAVTILHNGYVLGKSENGLDCSSFVSSALPADVRKGRFTTLDFRMMWIYRRHGTFPSPPHYSLERGRLIRETAEAFTAVDLYAGESLTVGDLLIYRLPWDPAGHVFIVKDFHPSQLSAEVIEAAQSAGTIREREFSLSESPPAAKIRLLRPGLMALRLRPVANRACFYGESRGLASIPESSAPGGDPLPGGAH